ncbi:ABC transporter substrate-binding protein [Cupriavidus sp. 30B13]|uniref:ABC transporter substrate-binding protein n=1 Tax=Cupriavidus sp. 30B13 TaxID=3384241 RepID=UPI003B8FFD2F
MKLHHQVRKAVLLMALGGLWTGAAHAADAACQPAKVAEKYPTLAGKTIRVGADPQTPPYVYRDAADFSKVVGVDADLARAVFDCIGIGHEFVLGAWSGLLPAVQSGQIDVMWDDLYYKAERAKVVDFSTYMTAATGALVPAGNPRKLAAPAGLCGLTASFAIGSSNEGLTRKHSEACVAAGKPAITMVPFQDLASGLRLLDSGRTDVIMWDLAFVDNLASTQKQKYARAFSVSEGFVVGAAVAKQRQDLLHAIHDGLRAVQAAGTQKRIFQKYGVDPALETASIIKAE